MESNLFDAVIVGERLTAPLSYLFIFILKLFCCNWTYINGLALRNSVNIIIYLFFINVVYCISFTIIPRWFFLGTSLYHNEALTNGYRL